MQSHLSHWLTQLIGSMLIKKRAMLIANPFLSLKIMHRSMAVLLLSIHKSQTWSPEGYTFSRGYRTNP
jgi:hypothetical protein